MYPDQYAWPAMVRLCARPSQVRHRHRNHPRAACWTVSRRARALRAPVADHGCRARARVMVPPAVRKAASEVSGLPASAQPSSRPRTTTDGTAGDGAARSTPGKPGFNFGRHRWLGLVARDGTLPGAALRVAVLLWELQNAERGCAWPSLMYIAAELKMHKSTVIRSLRILGRRGWITIAHRGGRHRTNEYRV